MKLVSLNMTESTRIFFVAKWHKFYECMLHIQQFHQMKVMSLKDFSVIIELSYF